MHKLYTRRAARRVAERATQHGNVPSQIAHDIANECRKRHLPYAIGFAMFEQESDFKNIYGHDAGGLNPGQVVTEENYKNFRSHVVATKGSGSNGVGLGQITYWTYIEKYRDLWKPKVQIHVAVEILADLFHRLGELRGIGAYNGGESNPNMAYSGEVRDKAERWRKILSEPVIEHPHPGNHRHDGPTDPGKHGH